jgi:peptidoglycan/xylan/chitin deacetylase (PgdA/CDA1 family)
MVNLLVRAVVAKTYEEGSAQRVLIEVLIPRNQLNSRMGKKPMTHMQLQDMNEHRHQFGYHGVKVLLYHRINPDGDSTKSEFSVDASTFRKQMEFLDVNGFRTITFKDYQLFLDGELELPKRPVMITFDDGYQMTHRLALPIMKEFSMKAVVFVVADSSLKVNNWDAPLGIELWKLLDQQQILDLHRAGFEIGSHTLTHRNLSLLPAEEARDEITRSRLILEKLLDCPVKTFSYPFGVVDEDTKHLVSDAGYEGAFGGWSGPLSFGGDAFEIRRIAIFRTVTMLGFALRLLTPFEKYRLGRWQLRRLTGFAGRILGHTVDGHKN